MEKTTALSHITTNRDRWANMAAIYWVRPLVSLVLLWLTGVPKCLRQKYFSVLLFLPLDLLGLELETLCMQSMSPMHSLCYRFWKSKPSADLHSRVLATDCQYNLNTHYWVIRPKAHRLMLAQNHSCHKLKYRLKPFEGYLWISYSRCCFFHTFDEINKE